jgi:catechol 2,3-dioxygenase-like lactoylglutathione lyase family enzyme
VTAAALRRIIAFRLVTHDPTMLTAFYADALGASAAMTGSLAGADREQLGVGERTVLTIGTQRLDLDVFAEPGARYPDGIAADDRRFQHCAFVVADIAAVHARALGCGAATISDGGPVALPASSGGAIAVKLRDPEGHPFELLQFPAGGQPDWERVPPNDHGVRGIDHSAITVADARASTAFYARHGLAVAGAGVNRGPSQAALDGLDDPVVDVVPLRPALPGPHLELLGYRGVAHDARATGLRDIAATRIAWASDSETLLVDPDGHRHQLVAD